MCLKYYIDVEYIYEFGYIYLCMCIYVYLYPHTHIQTHQIVYTKYVQFLYINMLTINLKNTAN